MLPYRGIPAGYEDENDEDDLDLMTYSTQNLKITVVPDITTAAGLNGQNFDCKLSPDMEQWFEEFRETYNKCKRTPATQHQLKLVLSRDPLPLLQALKLFASSPGCNYLKNKNMALFILETVCELYKQHPTIEASCDDNTRMVAFNFVKTCGIVPLYKAVTETYQLQKIQQYLIPKLQTLQAEGYYKDAAYWSIFLNVTHIFGLFDLILPLILQDKISLAEEFLKVAHEQQLPTVQFLDALLDRKKTVYENCDEVLKKYKYSEIKHNILSYRPMSKLVTRLAKKYNIDFQYTPNLKYSKSCSYLHYLFHKYQDGGMSFDSWRELAREEANKSKALQLDLIAKITGAGDLEEATYWAQLYKIPLEECPLALQLKLENLDSATKKNTQKSNSSSSSNESWDKGAATPTPKKHKHYASAYLKKDEYLSLKLPAESIVLVDSKPKFLDMLSYLEQHLLIGFDSEWKPSVSNDNRVSLIQLATIERVYLVDCLSPHLDERLWKLMGRKIFNNLEILKLGFSLHYDLQMLHKSLPLQLNLQATSCYLDLRDLWRRLKYMQISPFPYEQISVAGESLCALTEMCLGKKLDKSNQCSNWANRPLRHDQIVYAALDAHCLLQIYQVLTELLLRTGINIDAVVEDITNSKSGYLFRMKGKTSSGNAASSNRSWQQNGNEMERNKSRALFGKSSNIKFLCDSMLIGLSKELRKLGLDCVEIHNNIDINRYIDMARNEQRFVLTRDSRYLTFSSDLPQNQCLQIPSDSVEMQVLNILQYFQIQIDRRSLYTRCIQCNGNDFLLANRNEMKLMRFSQLRRNEANDTLPPYEESPEKLWKLQRVNDHIIETKTTLRGKYIKVNRINPYVLNNQNYFFICDNCGLCTWPDAVHLHQSVLEYLYPNSASGYATSSYNTNVSQ
ncbi:exonuclease mut-7 homolog [Lucilia cuprina]|uniref:exonuclease mut-7 homolog n=1 Tax=Lucilia cuprina TaxID=7375 RepID=UPI001F06F6F7|nr:exonuclease mut-7 homolog [Lucilia cuprina]